MQTNHTTVTATATTTKPGDEGAAALSAALVAALPPGSPRLVCVWASTRQPLGPLLAALAARFPEAVVTGCSTAGEFTNAGDTAGTAVAFALSGDFVVEVGLATGLKSDTEGAVTRATAGLTRAVPDHPHRAALVLFDGLAGVGEEATLHAAMALGDDVKVAGAAAGDDWAVRSTEVGTGARCATDAVVVCLIHARSPIGLGVRHGHEPFSASVVVTKSSESVVFELDHQPAWQRYAAVTRDRALADGQADPSTLTDAGARLSFFARYSPAIQAGSAWRNRNPLVKNDDGSLAFTCGIPEGTRLTLLHSDPERQIGSARSAARDAVADLGGVAVAGALVFDCVCRKVLLGARFNDAVSALADELKAPLCGFESYGEVALRAGDFSGFHNSTTVVLAFS